MDAHGVKRLVEEGEGPLLEFKPHDERPLALATTLAALANAEGGTVLIGIREMRGRPVIEGCITPS